MKKVLLHGLFFLLAIQVATAQYRTDRTGYEGDFFSLEGALELFKESRTLRDFERSLNTRDRWVNNLDLDYDGRTDYIRVEHRRQGNLHIIILQAIVGRYDVQDVAVIEIEQINRREAILQIIGDEDLYGQEVIVEPLMGYADSRRGYDTNYGEFVNVFYWPVVQYIMGPQYRTVYVSPYRWQYYPTWWNTWRPVTWTVFRPRIIIYRPRYRIINRYRFVRARRFYRPFRNYCYDVVVRSNQVRVRQGRRPIYRPRVNNRRPINNRRDGFRGRPNGRDRIGATRPNQRIARTDDRIGNSRGRNATARDNRPSRIGSRDQDRRRATASARRTPARTNRTPSLERNANRRATPRITTPTRRNDSRSGTIRSSRPEVKRPERTRQAPAVRQNDRRQTPSRINRPSRSSSSRRGTVRSPRAEIRQPARKRSSPSVRQSTQRSFSSRVRSSSRPSKARSVSPSRRTPSKAGRAGSVRFGSKRGAASRRSGGRKKNQ